MMGVTVGLMMALAAGASPVHAQEAAVSTDLVVRLLDAGLSTTAVINEIRGRCIDFNVDSPGVEQRLRAAGADNQLLQQLRGFCYTGAAGGGASGSGRKLQFGVFVGFARSSIVDYETTDVVEARSAPSFGIEVNYRPNASGFGFQTGAIYVPKGEYVPSSAAIPVGHTLRLDYVEIPFLASWTFALNGSGVRPAVLAGATVGLKAACRFEWDSGSIVEDFDCEEIIEVSSVDAGASLGVAVDIPINARFSVSPTVRYTRGLTDVSAEQGGKNSTLLAGVTIRLAN